MTKTNPNLAKTTVRLGNLAFSALFLFAACDENASTPNPQTGAANTPASATQSSAGQNIAGTLMPDGGLALVAEPLSKNPPSTGPADDNSRHASWIVGTPATCSPIAQAIGVFNGCGAATGLAFSPDGKFLAVGGASPNGLQVYRLSDGMPLAVSANGAWGTMTYAVAFSPDGRYLLAGITRDSPALATVMVFAVTSATEISQIGTLNVDSGGYSSSVVFSHDGSLVATAGGAGSVELWSTSDWTRVRKIPAPYQVSNVHFSRDDRKLLTVDYGDGKARVWNVADATLLLDSIIVSELDADADFSPDGTEIAASYAAGYLVEDSSYIRIWDATTGVMKKSFLVTKSAINHMIWLDADRIVANHQAEGPWTWTRQPSGDFVGAAKVKTGWPPLTQGFAISPDHNTVAVDWVLMSYDKNRDDFAYALGFGFFRL